MGGEEGIRGQGGTREKFLESRPIIQYKRPCLNIEIHPV